MRYLPDGTLLTAGAAEKDDGSLKVWDVETGTCVKAIAKPNTSVGWMDVAVDGKTAIVGAQRRERNFMIVPLPQ